MAAMHVGIELCAITIIEFGCAVKSSEDRRSNCVSSKRVTTKIIDHGKQPVGDV